MKVQIEPGYITGCLVAPSSKSMTQRAYAAALLHKGKTIIHHAGQSADEEAALQIIQELGAEITLQTTGKIEISSQSVDPASQTIHCGESGLSARLFTPIAAISGSPIKVEGTGSLVQRPMEGFEQTFSALSVSLSGFNGYIPFTIQGPLIARSVKINAASGSQLLSGLLFALSYTAKETVTIEVENLKSTPYIDLTLDVLSHFGKPVTHNNYRSFYIDPTLFTHKEIIETKIEGDWSSAAFWLVAGAISGNITIENLDIDSLQSDKAILEVLRDIGAEIIIGSDFVTVKKSRLKAFEFDATDCPDLFPILSILAACSEGESYIYGIHRLFHKESNRAESISEMLQNFDVPFSIEDDTLCISGVKRLQGTVIDSYNDHRIVMAAAIGALRANGPVDILHAEAVNKSYPDFFKDLILCAGKYASVQ